MFEMLYRYDFFFGFQSVYSYQLGGDYSSRVSRTYVPCQWSISLVDQSDVRLVRWNGC